MKVFLRRVFISRLPEQHRENMSGIQIILPVTSHPHTSAHLIKFPNLVIGSQPGGQDPQYDHKLIPMGCQVVEGNNQIKQDILCQ